MSKRKERVLLFLILGIAVFFRFFKLSSIPISLFGDEMDIGYQAYSIWKTGKDYLGYSWPLYFHSFYEHRMPLLVYLTAPVVGLFGLSEWTVRFLPAFFGVFNVLLFYWLVKSLTKWSFLALLAAFLMSITPWHIHLSRMAFDTTLMMTLILFSCFLLVKAVLQKNHFFFYFSAITIPLSFYAYSVSLVFSFLFFPVVFFLLGLANKKWLSRKNTIFGFIFFLAILPLFLAVFRGEATARFNGINIFHDSKTIDQVIYQRGQDNGGGRFYHNKLTAFSGEFLENYFHSFSTEFLFLSGDPNLRHSSSGGELFKIFAPFLVLGVVIALKNKNYWIFLVWLLFAPVSGSLTIDGGNHAPRLFLMIPPLLFLTSLGFSSFLDIIKNKIFKLTIGGAISFILFFELLFYSHQYFHHYSRRSWEYFDFGLKQAMKVVGQQQDKYDLIMINAKKPILIDFLFWNSVDPRWFQKMYDGQKWNNNIVPGFNGFRLGKFVFGYPNGELGDILHSGILYLAFQKEEIPGDWNWQESPPGGVKVIFLAKEPVSGNPYLYVLTSNEKE